MHGLVDELGLVLGVERVRGDQGGAPTGRGHRRHAAVEAADLPRVLDIVQPRLAEVLVVDLEEDLPGEKGVGARLVLAPDPLHLQLVGHGLEAAHEVVCAEHEVLDVVQVGEVDLQRLQEL